MFRGYNPTFLTLRGETIFQAKRGDQSRTTMAKGGVIPTSPPPLATYDLIHNSRPDKYLSVNVKKRVFHRKKNRIEIQEVTLPKGGAVDNLRKKGAIFGSRYILR